MEAALFIENQPFITAVQRPLKPDVNKRARTAEFACKASFHISFGEQNGASQELLGPKAQDAVFVRLLLSGGCLSSVLDISIPAQWRQLSQFPYAGFRFDDKTYCINATRLMKVTFPVDLLSRWTI